MSDRIPCCITGCRRTFRAEDCGNAEIMCSKHYRIVPELVIRFKDAKRKMRKITRLRRKAERVGKPLAVTAHLDKAWAREQAAMYALWESIKTEAQRRQDAGFFDRRRPQPKKDRHIVNPLSSKFEQQFQRMKAAMP